MYIGRFMLGDWVPLQVLTYNSSLAVVWPTDGSANILSPYVTVYDASLNRILTAKQIPAHDPDTTTGYHFLEQRLGPEFSTGWHMVLYEWRDAASSENKSNIDTFDVIAGGEDDGTYVGLHYYERPDSVQIVGVTDAGRIEARRNPRT